MKAEITILPGLTDQEIWERRTRKYMSLSPEEKFHHFCRMNQIASKMGANKARPSAKVTLKKIDGFI